MSATATAAPIVTIPATGQAYGGGFFYGITRDLVTGKRCLNITAGAEHELSGVWGEHGVKVVGADSFTDGRANTEAMAAAGSEIAQKVLALRVGGHDDWAIPARDQQELQYRNFKPGADENWEYGRSGDNPNSVPVGLLYSAQDPAQTAYAGFRDGDPEAFKQCAYWSSTQRSAHYAFGMDFGDGGQSLGAKLSELLVRPVRIEFLD